MPLRYGESEANSRVRSAGKLRPVQMATVPWKPFAVAIARLSLPARQPGCVGRFPTNKDSERQARLQSFCPNRLRRKANRSKATFPPSDERQCLGAAKDPPVRYSDLPNALPAF